MKLLIALPSVTWKTKLLLDADQLDWNHLKLNMNISAWTLTQPYTVLCLQKSLTDRRQNNQRSSCFSMYCVHGSGYSKL